MISPTISTIKLQRTINVGVALPVSLQIYAILKCFKASFTSSTFINFITMAHLFMLLQIALLCESLSAKNALQWAVFPLNQMLEQC